MQVMFDKGEDTCSDTVRHNYLIQVTPWHVILIGPRLMERPANFPASHPLGGLAHMVNTCHPGLQSPYDEPNCELLLVRVYTSGPAKIPNSKMTLNANLRVGLFAHSENPHNLLPGVQLIADYHNLMNDRVVLGKTLKACPKKPRDGSERCHVCHPDRVAKTKQLGVAVTASPGQVQEGTGAAATQAAATQAGAGAGGVGPFRRSGTHPHTVIHTHVHIHEHIHMHTYVRTYTRARTHPHIHTRTRAHTHVRARARTHTPHTCTGRSGGWRKKQG
jgi:hypothetical protein